MSSWRAFFDALDQRRWVGIPDRAILFLPLDALARVSEVTGLNLEDVDLEGRSIGVMGKGRRQRELPFGQVATQALRRYVRTVADHRPGDPFFISQTGRRLSREGITAAMRTYARRAHIQGVRSSPHTLRHTGAKRSSSAAVMSSLCRSCLDTARSPWSGATSSSPPPTSASNTNATAPQTRCSADRPQVLPGGQWAQPLSILDDKVSRELLRRPTQETGRGRVGDSSR
jgi:hypothetical protein